MSDDACCVDLFEIPIIEKRIHWIHPYETHNLRYVRGSRKETFRSQFYQVHARKVDFAASHAKPKYKEIGAKEERETWLSWKSLALNWSVSIMFTRWCIFAFAFYLRQCAHQFIVCYVPCKLFNSINRVLFVPFNRRISIARAFTPTEWTWLTIDLHRNAAGVRVHSEADGRARWKAGGRHERELRIKRTNKMPKQFVVFNADIFTPAIGQWTKWEQHLRRPGRRRL